MRAFRLSLLFLLPALPVLADDVCNPTDLYGPYAFQLTGSTSISGTPRPTAVLGRLVFDGHGSLTGTASATFRGLLLGNPVTGDYEAKSDCSVVFKLQDDSGAFQSFTGSLSPDGTNVVFKQTGPGAGPRGIMQKTSDACSASDLRKRYDYTVSGSTTPMLPGQVARSVSAKGTVDVSANGTFSVDTDCSVLFSLSVTNQDGEELPVNLRGFLVGGGSGILAFQTDPGAMVAARLSSPPPPR